MRSIKHFRVLELLSVAAVIACGAGSVAQEAERQAKPGDSNLQLHLRTRVETFKGSGVWDEIVFDKELPVRETAILICDMWDKHWCLSANKRCDALAHKMVKVIDAAHARGVAVIHAPSECMSFYKDSLQRRRMLEIPKVEPPKPLALTDPPLPIDASEGGCEDGPAPKNYRTWTRQHPAIPIGGEDVISDSGQEVYSFLQHRGIKNLIIMGVHTNMCVLGRSFAIRQMTRWGIRCVLVRDLTDAMYDPKKPPFVSHDEGTELVIQHIEKYWCPSILSEQLLTVGGRPAQEQNNNAKCDAEVFESIVDHWQKSFPNNTFEGARIHFFDGGGNRLHISVPVPIEGSYQHPFARNFLVKCLQAKDNLRRAVAQDLLDLKRPLLFKRSGSTLSYDGVNYIECVEYVVDWSK
jgi:nicotinamidase-related amidase